MPAEADASDPTLPAPPDPLPHFSTALNERGRREVRGIGVGFAASDTLGLGFRV